MDVCVELWGHWKSLKVTKEMRVTWCGYTGKNYEERGRICFYFESTTDLSIMPIKMSVCTMVYSVAGGFDGKMPE